MAALTKRYLSASSSEAEAEPEEAPTRMAAQTKRSLPPPSSSSEAEAEETNKKKPTTRSRSSSSSHHHQLSEDVLLIEVLTWLPAKSLCRFKAASRVWSDAITTDPLFNLVQSRRQTPMSTGVICYSNKLQGLHFFPALGEHIGVPDPRLPSLARSRLKILASVHGLLLLTISSTFKQYLYVCNPATQTQMRISPGLYRCFALLGLAFDPSVSPRRFKLIYAKREKLSTDDYVHSFHVFSSSTGEWTASPAGTIHLGSREVPKRVVFADGVVYWYYWKKGIMSYDTHEDEARFMALPPRTWKRWEEEEIGVWEEKLTCTRAGQYGVEVWVLRKKKGEWEMKHRFDMDRVIRRNPDVFRSFANTTPPRNKYMWPQLKQTWWPKPMGFEDGKNIYLRVLPKEKREGMEMVEVILGFDVEAQNAMVFGEIPLDFTGAAQPFSYHNSLVALPESMGS